MCMSCCNNTYYKQLSFFYVSHWKSPLALRAEKARAGRIDRGCIRKPYSLWIKLSVYFWKVLYFSENLFCAIVFAFLAAKKCSLTRQRVWLDLLKVAKSPKLNWRVAHTFVGFHDHLSVCSQENRLYKSKLITIQSAWLLQSSVVSCSFINVRTWITWGGTPICPLKLFLSSCNKHFRAAFFIYCQLNISNWSAICL